jgi:phosphoribosylformylglycinamidine synthase
VITAVAHVPDVGRTVTAELTAPGNLLMLLGSTAPEFAGSHLDLVLGAPDDPGAVPQPDAEAPRRYRALHTAIRAGLVQACHDVSEGGLAVALAELCIAGRLGATIDRLAHADMVTALFAESTGRHVIEVRPDDVAELEAIVGPTVHLGVVTAEPMLSITGLAPIHVDDLVAAFAGASE